MRRLSILSPLCLLALTVSAATNDITIHGLTNRAIPNAGDKMLWDTGTNNYNMTYSQLQAVILTNVPAENIRGSLTLASNVTYYADAIRDLKCDPTGVQDCSAKIQAGFGSYQNIVFPSGLYLITNSLAVPSMARVYGPGTWFFTGCDIGANVTAATNVLLDGLTMIGTTRVSVLFYLSTNCAIRYCQILEGGQIRNGTFPNAAIMLGDSSKITVQANYISGIGCATNYDSTAAIISGDSYGGVDHCKILDNRIQGNATAPFGILLFDFAEGEVTGNQIDQANAIGANTNAGGYGIAIYATGPSYAACYGDVVSGNVIRNTAGTGIYLKDLHASTITGNTLTNVCQQQSPYSLPVAGIAANSCRGLVVSGNAVSGSKQDGINCVNFSGTITGNSSISNKVAGIRLANATNTVTTANKVVGSQYGILVDGYGANNITANSIDYCDYGLFSGANHNTTNSVFHGNIVNHWTVYGAVEVLGSTNVFTQNSVLGTGTETGISLQSTGSRSDNNYFRNLALAVDLKGAGNSSTLETFLNCVAGAVDTTGSNAVNHLPSLRVVGTAKVESSTTQNGLDLIQRSPVFYYIDSTNFQPALRFIADVNTNSAPFTNATLQAGFEDVGLNTGTKVVLRASDTSGVLQERLAINSAGSVLVGGIINATNGFAVGAATGLNATKTIYTKDEAGSGTITNVITITKGLVSGWTP